MKKKLLFKKILVFGPGNRENKFISKIIAQFILPTYKPSIKKWRPAKFDMSENSASTVTPNFT